MQKMTRMRGDLAVKRVEREAAQREGDGAWGRQVDPGMITKTKKLGEGGQGSVWLGTYKLPNGAQQPVAVKSMKGGLTQEILNDLAKEVLKHPYVD